MSFPQQSVNFVPPAFATTVQGQIGTLQGQVSTVQGQVGTLQTQVPTLQGQVSTIQGQVGTGAGVISTGRITASSVVCSTTGSFSHLSFTSTKNSTIAPRHRADFSEEQYERQIHPIQLLKMVQDLRTHRKLAAVLGYGTGSTGPHLPVLVPNMKADGSYVPGGDIQFRYVNANQMTEQDQARILIGASREMLVFCNPAHGHLMGSRNNRMYAGDDNYNKNTIANLMAMYLQEVNLIDINQINDVLLKVNVLEMIRFLKVWEERFRQDPAYPLYLMSTEGGSYYGATNKYYRPISEGAGIGSARESATCWLDDSITAIPNGWQSVGDNATWFKNYPRFLCDWAEHMRDRINAAKIGQNRQLYGHMYDYNPIQSKVLAIATGTDEDGVPRYTWVDSSYKASYGEFGRFEKFFENSVYDKDYWTLSPVGIGQPFLDNLVSTNKMSLDEVNEIKESVRDVYNNICRPVIREHNTYFFATGTFRNNIIDDDYPGLWRYGCTAPIATTSYATGPFSLGGVSYSTGSIICYSSTGSIIPFNAVGGGSQQADFMARQALGYASTDKVLGLKKINQNYGYVASATGVPTPYASYSDINNNYQFLVDERPVDLCEKVYDGGMNFVDYFNDIRGFYAKQYADANGITWGAATGGTFVDLPYVNELLQPASTLLSDRETIGRDYGYQTGGSWTRIASEWSDSATLKFDSNLPFQYVFRDHYTGAVGDLVGTSLPRTGRWSGLSRDGVELVTINGANVFLACTGAPGPSATGVGTFSNSPSYLLQYVRWIKDNLKPRALEIMRDHLSTGAHALFTNPNFVKQWSVIGGVNGGVASAGRSTVYQTGTTLIQEVYCNETWDTVNPRQFAKTTIPATLIHESLLGHHVEILYSDYVSQTSEKALYGNQIGNVNVRESSIGFRAPSVEGWAVYAEFLGIKYGLYGQPTGTNITGNDPFVITTGFASTQRVAGRMVGDVALNYGKYGWSYSKTERKFRDQTGLSAIRASSFSRRFYNAPFQSVTYGVGAIQMLSEFARCKAAIEAAGRVFNERDFHDFRIKFGVIFGPALTALFDEYIKIKTA
jgi:hypothetical protein